MSTYRVDRRGRKIGKLEIKDGIVILRGKDKEIEIKIDNGIWELYLNDEHDKDLINAQLIKKE